MNNKELLKKIKFHLEQQKKGWKHLIYGLGGLYQSFDELKIKGKRNTENRIKEYELKKYIKNYYNILDIGCNCGFIDLKLAKYVNSIDGVEINPFLVAIGNEVKTYLKIKNVNFHPIGFEEYETDKKYEAIFSFAADEVADDLSKLSFTYYIKKILSLMTMDGYLLFESQASDILEGTWKPKYDFLKKNFKIIKEKKVFSDYPISARERAFLILQKKG